MLDFAFDPRSKCNHTHLKTIAVQDGFGRLDRHIRDNHSPSSRDYNVHIALTETSATVHGYWRLGRWRCSSRFLAAPTAVAWRSSDLKKEPKLYLKEWESKRVPRAISDFCLLLGVCWPSLGGGDPETARFLGAREGTLEGRREGWKRRNWRWIFVVRKKGGRMTKY